MKKMKPFFSGVFWGGLLGSIAGLLSTPFSGMEIRQKISRFNPAEIKNEIVDPALDTIDRGISKIDKAVEEGKIAMEQKRKELEKKGGDSANRPNS